MKHAKASREEIENTRKKKHAQLEAGAEMELVKVSVLSPQDTFVGGATSAVPALFIFNTAPKEILCERFLLETSFFQNQSRGQRSHVRARPMKTGIERTANKDVTFRLLHYDL